MRWLRNFWRRLTTSTETALLRQENRQYKETNFVLEEELAQARKEIRALENTALAQAGATPLPPHDEIVPVVKRIRHLTHQQRQRMYAIATVPKREEKDEDGRRVERSA